MNTTLPEIQTTIRTFAQMRQRAQELGPKRVGVVLAEDDFARIIFIGVKAEDDVALTAAAEAMRANIANPVLIGEEKGIRARAERLGFADLVANAEYAACGNDPKEAGELAVNLVREGRIEILLKGHLRTDQLLPPVLDREKGLRTGRLLCDVAFFEHTDDAGTRLVGMSDGGMTPAPNLKQKKQIVLSAIEVLGVLGITQPKIAILSAVEVVSEALPSTVDAKALTEMCEAGEFGDAQVFGPLALDNAMLEWCARIKGITHPVAGHADCLVMPTIEAGNIAGKIIHVLYAHEFAHVVVGAKVPILIPSRIEAAINKIDTMALGVIYAGR